MVWSVRKGMATYQIGCDHHLFRLPFWLQDLFGFSPWRFLISEIDLWLFPLGAWEIYIFRWSCLLQTRFLQPWLISKGCCKLGFLQLVAVTMTLVQSLLGQQLLQLDPSQKLKEDTLLEHSRDNPWIRLGRRLLSSYHLHLRWIRVVNQFHQARLLWTRLQGIWLITPMNRQQQGAFVVSKSKPRGGAGEGSATGRWVLTMPAMLSCLGTSGRLDPRRENDRCWCWTAGIIDSRVLFKGGFWTKYWRMQMLASTWFLMPARCDRQQQVITATCSWSRHWTTTSWWWRPPWLRMVQCHVESGITTLREWCPMWLFSLLGGQSWLTSHLLGLMWKWRWREIFSSIWNFGAIALTTTCQCRSAMWRILCSGRLRRSRSFPLSWWQCSKDGGWSPHLGKLEGDSMLFQKEEWW